MIELTCLPLTHQNSISGSVQLAMALKKPKNTGLFEKKSCLLFRKDWKLNEVCTSSYPFNHL